MAIQLRCRCGANLTADPQTTAVVCGACGTTVAVPQPERELALAETAPAMPQHRPVPRTRAPSALTLGAVGIVGVGIALVILASRDTSPAKPARPAVPVTEAVAVTAVPDEPQKSAASVEELVVLERSAISRADESALLALLAPNAFVHGPDRDDVAYDAKTGAPLIRSLGGAIVESTFSKIVQTKDVAWIVDELEAGGVKLLTSQLAFRDGTTWRVAAWHLARTVPNQVAYQRAKDGLLPVPMSLEARPDDDQQVYDAFRAAFATREAFVAAFSDRADAIDLGSAPGERIVGGAAVKRAFTKIAATFGAHDHTAAGRVDDRTGWAAANINFTMAIEGVEVTQTFRVLAVFVREPAGWRIVLAQWSNAGPLT